MMYVKYVFSEVLEINNVVWFLIIVIIFLFIEFVICLYSRGKKFYFVVSVNIL